MRIKMPQVELIQALQIYSKETRELRQVVKRLREVLPERLNACKRSATGKGTKKERNALIHADYQRACEELVNLRFS